MQLPSVEVMLSWPPANYDNPSEVRGPTLLVLALIFVPLLVILVALRTYTRLRLSKNFGADDIAIVAAVFPTIGCAVTTVLAALYHGWSRHLWDVPLDQLVLGLKFVIAVEILFSVACSLTKLSMLLLIYRLMAGQGGFLRHLSIAVMVVVMLEMFIFSIVVLTTCSPISEYWTLSLTPQNCINEGSHLLAGGVVNTITDFFVVLIPIPVVMKLRLPLRQRIYCALLFGAGFVVCIAGSFRIAYTYELTYSDDKTWLAYPLWISGTVELYLGIMATSIPAIKPLVSRHFPRMLSGSFNNRNQSPTHGAQGHFRSLEPHKPRSQSKSSLLDDDGESIHLSPATSATREKPGPELTSKPLPLAPVLSSFSTYTKILSPTRPKAVHFFLEEKKSQPGLGMTEAPKANDGSSDPARRSAQVAGSVPPKSLRKENAKEVPKGDGPGRQVP